MNILIGNKNSNVLKMRWRVLHPSFELLRISQPWSWPTPSHVAKSSSLSTDWLLWNEFARFHNSMFLITNLNVLALPKILKGIKRMHYKSQSVVRVSRYFTHSAPHLREDTLKALQKNSRNWRFGDLHYYLSRRSPSGVIISDVAKPVFLNEDSKNALTKEMVDIASMMKEKLTGCQQQKPKKSGFSFSVCHCQLTKFFTTYFCLQHTVFENHSKQSHFIMLRA